MNDPLVLSSIGTLLVATYLSALNLALMNISLSALEQRCTQEGGIRHGVWLVNHVDAAALATALLRTVARFFFFVLVLVKVIGLGEALSRPGLVISGVVAVTLIWLFTTVLATALARYAGLGLVTYSALVIRVVSLLCYPFTWSTAFIDEAVRRLSGANLKTQDAAAEAELLRSIEDTQRQGALDEGAVELMGNVMEFSSKDVSEVMTPRTDIEGIALTDDLASIREFIAQAGHSRIPVFEDNLDTIVGILYVKDLIDCLGEDAPGFELRPRLRSPVFIPESKPVRELLAEFQQSEVHLAIVIDEYGGTAGLVTIEDLLEEIVGEIHDEHEPEDEEEPAIVLTGDGRAEVDGRFHIDDLNEQLDLDLPEEEEFDTVGGFVLAALGRVPAIGDSFEAHRARFTALAATRTHVQKIGIELLTGPGDNGEPGASPSSG